jgi:hypothetical protein
MLNKRIIFVFILNLITIFSQNDNYLKQVNQMMGHKKVIWQPEGSFTGEGENAILVFHGLGDRGHDGYSLIFPNIKNCVIYTPEMPYSAKFLADKTGIISMGGKADLIAAIISLNKLKLAGYKNVCLYGLSCGGGVATNLIYALQNPTEYKEIFKKLNIKPNELREIVKICILDRPFSDFYYAARSKIGGLAWLVDKTISARKAINIVFNSSYEGNVISLDGISPIKAAEKINNIPLLIHAAKKDDLVGYDGSVELYNITKKNNKSQLVESDIYHNDPINQNLQNKFEKFITKYF